MKTANNLIQANAQKNKEALDVLQEFVEDVKLAFGTGKGNQIDAMHLDWPDLEQTYEKALKVLGLEPPDKKPRKKRKS